jgi:hypothetical protein
MFSIGKVIFRLMIGSAICVCVMGSVAKAGEKEAVSVWEKICLSGTTAACEKASKVLASRFDDLEITDVDSAIRSRLIEVSQKGCESGQLSSCAALINVDESKASLKLANDTAQERCGASHDKASASCNLVSLIKTIGDSQAHSGSELELQ